MTTTVIQAHPVEDSFNAALLVAVRRGLDAAGVDHAVHRLWQEPHPEPGDIAGVERLVLVYPTWLSGPPAMLLGWLQRMVGSRALGSVATLGAVTTHGSSRFTNIVQGEWGRRYLTDRVAGSCRPGTRLDWHALYKIDRRTPAEIAAFLAATEQHLAAGLLPAR